MQSLLIALSLFTTKPDSTTETIRLQNFAPSEVIGMMRNVDLFRSEIAIYGSDVDRTVTVVGSEKDRTEFKRLIRMLDVPRRQVQLKLNIVNAAIVDGRLVKTSVFQPETTALNNMDTEFLFKHSDTPYRLIVRSRVNNDGTTSSFMGLSRFDKQGEAAEFGRTTRRLKPGQTSGFVGFSADAVGVKRILVTDGTIPEAGFTSAVFIELTATAK